MLFGFRLVERFDPSHSDSWKGYVEWSKLFHVQEIVSLDLCLCPAVLKSFSDDDWQHAVYAEYLMATFDDWRYAASRIPDQTDRSSIQVLRGTMVMNTRRAFATRAGELAHDIDGYVEA